MHECFSTRLNRERRLLLDAATRTRQKANELAGKTGADLDALQPGLFPHPEGQDMDLLELEGELQLLKSIEEQLRILEIIEICPTRVPAGGSRPAVLPSRWIAGGTDCRLLRAQPWKSKPFSAGTNVITVGAQRSQRPLRSQLPGPLPAGSRRQACSACTKMY